MHPPTNLQRYVRYNQWPFYTAWGLSIAVMLVIICVEKARRSYPLNMIMLFVFTIAEAFLVGMITARFTIEVVMLAFLITAVAVGEWGGDRETSQAGGLYSGLGTWFRGCGPKLDLRRGRG
jgi:FtsH-binding integral membrane protein